MRFPSRRHGNRHGVFGFRIIVPVPLRPRFRRQEIRFTLKTTDPNIPKRVALQLSTRFPALQQRLARITDQAPAELSRLLLDDLAGERDRLLAELLRVAEIWVCVDERDEAIGGQIHVEPWQALVGSRQIAWPIPGAFGML
jgi:hypothetical protein